MFTITIKKKLSLFTVSQVCVSELKSSIRKSNVAYHLIWQPRWQRQMTTQMTDYNPNDNQITTLEDNPDKNSDIITRWQSRCQQDDHPDENHSWQPGQKLRCQHMMTIQMSTRWQPRWKLGHVVLSIEFLFFVFVLDVVWVVNCVVTWLVT
jgi:hypothetical protein